MMMMMRFFNVKFIQNDTIVFNGRIAEPRHVLRDNEREKKRNEGNERERGGRGRE